MQPIFWTARVQSDGQYWEGLHDAAVLGVQTPPPGSVLALTSKKLKLKEQAVRTGHSYRLLLILLNSKQLGLAWLILHSYHLITEHPVVSGVWAEAVKWGRWLGAGKWKAQLSQPSWAGAADEDQAAGTKGSVPGQGSAVGLGGGGDSW
jgi:hypothetical protein